MPKIEIDLTCGIGKVLIDGRPLHEVTSIEITCKPGEPTVAKLVVYATGLKVKDADASIEIKEQQP